MGQNNPVKAPEKILKSIIMAGVRGGAGLRSASQVATECLKHSDGDIEKAISKVIASHTRNVGVSGFVSGLGGFATMVVSVPADVSAYYINASRMVAAVAYLRGYDIDSEEVESMIALTLLGSAGVEVAAKAGVKIAEKGAAAALKKLPGRVLIEINKKVGFRLFTKFGEKGAINLAKGIPLLGGVIGGGVNVATFRAISSYARLNFPEVEFEDFPSYQSATPYEEDIVDAEIID